VFPQLGQNKPNHFGGWSIYSPIARIAGSHIRISLHQHDQSHLKAISDGLLEEPRVSDPGTRSTAIYSLPLRRRETCNDGDNGGKATLTLTLSRTGTYQGKIIAWNGR
jgi:hypothetical protein